MEDATAFQKNAKGLTKKSNKPIQLLKTGVTLLPANLKLIKLPPRGTLNIDNSELRA